MSDVDLISPFISGTFDGFEEEFNHLYSNIFPRLDDLCKSRGTRFLPSCDRRTAIETRSSSSLQLSNALDCIKKCSPYFMAIFGQQYGPHRPVKETVIEMKAGHGRQSIGPGNLSLVDLNIVTASKRGHWWLLDKKWQYCSMLEMEIQAAALETEPASKHCYFYIRDFKKNYLKQGKENDTTIDALSSIDGYSLFEAESAYAEKKLDALKLRICKRGWPVKYFSSPAELGEMIVEDWAKIVELMCPSPYVRTEFNDALRWNHLMVVKHTRRYRSTEELSEIKQILTGHCLRPSTISNTANALIEQSDELFETAPQPGFGLFSSCMPRKDHLALQNQTSSPGKKILVLVGDAGSGKTSLIARWLQQFKESDTLILSEFIGTTQESRDIGFIMRRCVKVIRELVFKRKMTQAELLQDTSSFSTLSSVFRNCLGLAPCVLVLDSVNDLKPSMEQDISLIKKLDWLPDTLPDSCRVVFSTRRSDLSFKVLSSRQDVQLISMPAPSKYDQIAIVKDAMPHRQASIGTTNSEKLTVNRLSEKPLFLVTLSGLISSCVSEREVNKVIEKCTELRTFRDFWKTTFTLWTLRFSWRKNSNGQPGSCRNFNSGWVADALRIISVSRNGLHVNEILHVLYLIGYKGKCTVTPYDWSLFQNAARDAFNVLPEGNIALSHIEIRHAAKFHLLGMSLPSATASASSIGVLNTLQHYHAVLAKYFLKFGNLDRKITELPWQLEQSSDMVGLSQVLSKPRFFEAFYRKALTHHQLMVDLTHFWRVLDNAGFPPSHYMQLMIEKACEKSRSGLFGENWQADGMGFGSLRTGSTWSTSSMRRTSIAFTNMDDRRQSTVGTRSETGDFDMMSEMGQGFFVTETEPLVDHRGWNPNVEDPECSIDESVFTADESCELSYHACIMLKHLGEGYISDCKDGLSTLSQSLMELGTLSIKQQKIHAKTLCSLAQLSSDDGDFARCLCQDASEIIVSLSGQLPISPRGTISENRIISLRRIAESFIEKGEFDKAEEILGDAESWLKQFEGVTENLETKFTHGKLYFHQGLRGQAEESLKQVLIEKLKWFGPDHVSVADVMHYLADLYAVLEAEGLSKRRLSMLTYREAFRIYQRNKEKHKEAIMLHKIGTQLNREGSLISTNEAKECLENAMDIYTTEIGPAHSDVTGLQRNVKKISDNLRKGYYKFGTAKPPDKRTPEFLYSSMTWHDYELQKIGKRRKLRSAPPAYGNRSMMSSRDTFRIHTPRSLPDGRKGLLRKEDSESNSVLKKDDHHVIIKLDVVPPAQSATPHRADQDRFEDEVIVVPGGRDSRQMSAKTRLAEGSEKSVSIRLPEFRRNKIPLIEEHSEWSAFSDTTTARRVSAKISHATHRKSCRPASGPNNLCLSVHGPHSSVISVLESTLQPRKDKKTDLVHKSAWYNVPGRYTLPGKVLPQKHNQIRPDSRLSSRRSHRSFQTV